MTEKECNFWKRYSKNMVNCKNLRLGQVLFNTIYEIDPNFSVHIAGTNLDPFHKKDHELEEIFDELFRLFLDF